MHPDELPQVPECPFCRIASGEIPAYVVYEDEQTCAFLDHRPLFRGHCLVVPRGHYETLPDLPAELVGPLFQSVQLLAAAVPDAMGADGTFIAVNNRVSQSVPHLHVHVVPRRKGDGLRGFFWPRQRYASEAEMARTRDAIRLAVERALAGRD